MSDTVKVAMCNVLIIMCFIALAIMVDKWWVSLFAVLFQMKYHSNDERTTDKSEEDA